MTTTLINLNKARKAKARAEGEIQAAENRIRFGRTKAEKKVESLAATKAARDLDGHKRGQ